MFELDAERGRESLKSSQYVRSPARRIGWLHDLHHAGRACRLRAGAFEYTRDRKSRRNIHHRAVG
jgi:hypothetical protein